MSRSQPFDWKAQGFLVGQPVHITGFRQVWKVIGFGDPFDGDTVDNSVMHLQLVTAPVPRAAVPASRSTSTRDVLDDGYAVGAALTRASGSWVTDGFALDQHVTSAEAFTAGAWQVLGVSATTLLLGNGPGIATAPSATKT